MEQISAAGGILYRQKKNKPEILVIFRRGVWDLPKGKKENGETFEECAVREVSEEVGVDAPVLDNYLTDTYHEYEENGVRIGKTTKWYSMKIPNPDAILYPQGEEGIEKLLWLSPTEAKERMGFENLIKVITSFEEKLN